MTQQYPWRSKIGMSSGRSVFSKSSMFTTIPGAGSSSPVSGSTRDRLVGYFAQRLPFGVTGDAVPMSCAQPSGTTPGSTTIRVPAGTCSTSQARVSPRVSSRDSTRPSCTE